MTKDPPIIIIPFPFEDELVPLLVVLDPILLVVLDPLLLVLLDPLNLLVEPEALLNEDPLEKALIGPELEEPENPVEELL